MGLLSINRGPLKAVMLAGVVLGFVMQMVQAQNRFFVTKEPKDPKVGQEVTLTPHGHAGHINLCQWFRESTSGRSGEILSYTSFLKQSNQQPERDIAQSNPNSNGSAYTGRETLSPNCSLRIQKLTSQDTGNYTVVMETVEQRQGGQEEVKALQAFIYLQVKATAQQIDIKTNVEFPNPGQSITLTPEVKLQQVTFCEWALRSHSGHLKPIVRQIPGQQVKQMDSDYSGRTNIRDNCALEITQLRITDTNNYVVTIRAPVQQHGQPQHPQQPQRPQQPGQRDHNQEEYEQEYTGEVYINIVEKHTGTKSSSASLSYSAGIVAGGLFGSLAMSLFSVLSGSFALWKPKHSL